tara:strand:- start:2120 stop:2362 length:243 start_codon:yes stop_codon:yes gene_type:complete
MDKELQDYYEKLLELFSTDGWKQYIEDISDNIEYLMDITTIPDEKQFWFRRGQIEAAQRILAYESSIKNSYEDFEREAHA